MLDSAKIIIGDKVRIIGQEYSNNSYDVIVDMQCKYFIIEDGCRYKASELIALNTIKNID